MSFEKTINSNKVYRVLIPRYKRWDFAICNKVLGHDILYNRKLRDNNKLNMLQGSYEDQR